MNNEVIIAQISLHYEERPTIIHTWTRERYQQAIEERKKDASMRDWYYKRITESKADKIRQTQQREARRKQIDQAVMEKYGVGADWRNNRWFVEQVRPTV